LVRLRPPIAEKGVLRLRLSVAARDSQGEGALVGNFASLRDLDLKVQPNACVGAAARNIASVIRRRDWSAPDSLADDSGRVLLNVRPLLVASGVGADPFGAAALRHKTPLPPVHGELSWDRRNIYYPLWLMADQMGPYEWVLYSRVQWERPYDTTLGEAISSVLHDLGLKPSAPLLPP